MSLGTNAPRDFEPGKSISGKTMHFPKSTIIFRISPVSSTALTPMSQLVLSIALSSSLS